MTEISSVSGLRGVRELIAEALYNLRIPAIVRNWKESHSREYHYAQADAVLAALSLPPSPQAAPCGIIGYPEQGRQVCELLAGHEGYHRQDGVRWLGCWKPWDATPQAPAGAQGQVQGVRAEEPWCELCGHTGWLRDSDGNRTERCPCTQPSPPADVSSQAGEHGCHAGTDGDCIWSECPQLKQRKSICPLWKDYDDEAAPSAGSGQEGLREGELESLIVHMWVHSGYTKNGYQQMTTPQKALYDSLIGRSEEIAERDMPQTAVMRERADAAALLPSASKPPATLSPMELEEALHGYDSGNITRTTVLVRLNAILLRRASLERESK